MVYTKIGLYKNESVVWSVEKIKVVIDTPYTRVHEVSNRNCVRFLLNKPAKTPKGKKFRESSKDNTIGTAFLSCFLKIFRDEMLHLFSLK